MPKKTNELLEQINEKLDKIVELLTVTDVEEQLENEN